MTRNAREPGVGASRHGTVGRWWRGHRWALGHSLMRLREHPLGTLLTVLVMGLALSLPLSFYLVQTNLARLSRALGSDTAVNAFLQTGQGQVQAEALAQSLQTDAAVAAVHLKSPREGLAEMAALQGFGPAIDALPDNPLPWVLVIKPKPGDGGADIGALVKRLRGNPAIALVQDQGQFRARLDALAGFGHRAMQVLAVLLGLAALLVVGASVRNDILGRAEEIRVLQLVGASAAFVRRPYLYAGLWLGLFSGLVAVALVLALEGLLAGPAARLDVVWGGRLGFEVLGVTPLLVLLGLAAMLGWSGARMASARHLAEGEPT